VAMKIDDNHRRDVLMGWVIAACVLVASVGGVLLLVTFGLARY
jgi:hypothetical protein